MKISPPALGIAAAAATFSLLLWTAPAADAAKEPNEEPEVIRAAPLSDVEKASHLLHRLGYGPQPGDIERVIAKGFSAYIEEQLAPEKMDVSELQKRLAPLESIHLATEELTRLFPPGFVLRRLAEQGAIEEKYLPRRLQQLRRREARQAGDGAPPEAAEDQPPEPGMAMAFAGRGKGNPIYQPIERLPEPLEMPGPGGRFRRPIEGVNPQQQVVMQLQAAKLLRAVYSPRQLEEVMADFWMNHFNVFIQKGPTRLAVTSYERDVIRPHALGNFRQLLGATARSPAMLTYLDNFQSVSPNSPLGRRRGRGLNENYARELMELHTLGVDGGYTQQDVVEVARVFTGWTIFNPRQGGSPGFHFLAAAHDPGAKTVLGHKIEPAGAAEGEQVLDILAGHPSTARFLATKLVRRFVSDEPPQSLVSEVAATCQKSGGDIRAMLRTIFYSKEFWSREAYLAKVKKPLELVASALRATGAEVTPTPQLLAIFTRLGEPLYHCQPPTGYPDAGGEWLNTGTLLYRWNFALGAAAGRIPGVTPPGWEGLEDTPAQQVIGRLGAGLLPGRLTAEGRERLIATMQSELGAAWRGGDAPLPERGIQLAAGVLLGSPEFQKR